MGLSVAAGLLVGVSVVQLFPCLPPLWLGGLLVVAAVLAFQRWPFLRPLAACVLGLAWASVVGRGVVDARLPVAASGLDLAIEGRVAGLPLREPDSIRFDFQLTRDTAVLPAGRKLRLGWYGTPTDLAPGSRWRLQVRLKRPRGVLNSGGHDFEKAALVQRIAATGYVRDPWQARQLAKARGVDAWRDGLSQAIERALPAGRGRFVRALAIGDTRGLDDADWETLRATGLTHQIAISGFHVGMVAGVGALLMSAFYRLFPGLGRYLPSPQGRALSALLFAAVYTALAGFALPTVRTLLMIAAVLLARLLRRPQSPGNAYALATIAVLLFDPLSVLTPGYWLSFIGVAWLLWCLPQEGNAGLVAPFLRSQGVAVLGLLPLTVWFFGQASLPGPLANLVGIPVISLVVVPLCLLGLALHPLSTSLATLAWQASAVVMEALWYLLEVIARWPAATVWFPEPGLLALVLACAGAFWLLLPRGTPGKWLAVSLFLPLFWPGQEAPGPGQAQVTVIDVGQGLSVLVRTKDHAMLVDAGPASARGLDMGEAAVLPALRALGVNRLDRIVISHGDNDHAGGLGALRRAWPATPVQGPPGWHAANVATCLAGQAWQWDGVSFRVLHPPPLFPYLRNDSSCVLRIEAAGSVALLPGDIGRHVESRLVREQAPFLRADLLLAPHHGSDSSSSSDFVAAVRPAWVVYATGANNRFHLPRASVVDRYRVTGARGRDTAGSGAMEFRLDADGAHLVSARRQDRPRYWREPLGTGSGYAIGSPDSER